MTGKQDSQRTLKRDGGRSRYDEEGRKCGCGVLSAGGAAAGDGETLVSCSSSAILSSSGVPAQSDNCE